MDTSQLGLPPPAFQSQLHFKETQAGNWWAKPERQRDAMGGCMPRQETLSTSEMGEGGWLVHLRCACDRHLRSPASLFDLTPDPEAPLHQPKGSMWLRCQVDSHFSVFSLVSRLG